MGFLGLRKPFQKESVDDYTDVLVPLSQAQRHSSVIAQWAQRRSTERSLSLNNGSIDDKNEKSKENVELGLSRTSSQISGFTIEDLKLEVDEDVAATGKNTVYDRKSKLINLAIQDIGMGRYNWELFVLCGFGWFADNLWLQGTALTLPSISEEFGITDQAVRYTTCSLFTGLCIGASFWGIGSDIVGRRFAFNATLFLAGVFGLVVGFSPGWTGVCGMYAALGVGIGGNLPVDGALLLESLPSRSDGLLTLLSVWWPIGQLVASLLAWAFIGGRYPVNSGWRYLTHTLGALTFLMFISRFATFHLYESPKFLISRGRQDEAVAAVHGIAHKNKTTTWLTSEILETIGGSSASSEATSLSTRDIIRRKLSSFGPDHIGPLFATRKLASTTLLLWFCWFTIGMGYPLFNSFLPQYLSLGHGASGAPITAYETYRNYAITSCVGVPGSFLAYYTVNVRYIGRKGTMAISTLLSAIFLFLFTVSANANYQLVFSAIEAFFQNIMYGVLFAYTPEVFSAPNRGTATGIASCLNRIGGLCAPIIAANIPGANPNVPVFVSGGLILAAFVAMILLPIETRGKTTL